MTYKTLAVGMILFLSSACLPHPGSLPEKAPPPPPAAREEASLLTPTESKNVPSQEIPPLPPAEPSPPSSPSPAGDQPVSSLDFPISDEANDDFSFEVLSKDRPKPKQEFDIPSVT